ncbi:retrovirus-related pol polyprotein from transposon TNT 1-94 [Tanacetum coccineum]
MATPAPQDIWSRDKHIELVNIMGNPGAEMLIGAIAKELSAASAHECLFKQKDETCIVIKNKARLVAQGYRQEECIDYDETIALVVLRAVSSQTMFANWTKPFMDLNMLQEHGTPSLGLWYPKCSGFDLKGYSDAVVISSAGCNIDRKSTSGACQLLGGKLVYLSAKKQQSVAMYSANAKYVATAGCCANILWMKSQPSEYDIVYEKVLKKDQPERPPFTAHKLDICNTDGLCMSTRSTSLNLFSPLRDPKSLIRRRNLGEPLSLFDFEEVMSIPHNKMGSPLVGPPPPNNNGPPPMVRPNGQAPQSMEELCQPSIDGRGRPIAPIPI